MPTTRKKIIKTVYKEENDSDEAGDFSDSGSDVVLSQHSSSEDEVSENVSEEEHFQPKSKKKQTTASKPKKRNFTKNLINKITKQHITQAENDETEDVPFSIKDLTAADKLLPSILNLSESDSSDDEATKTTKKKTVLPIKSMDSNSDSEINNEYKDVWSNNIQDQSEEIARKTYLELEKHHNKIEETKKSIQKYSTPTANVKESDVNDLLALGEEELPKKSNIKVKRKNLKDGSDSELEDWEEVNESKAIPKQGLQLILKIPDSVCRKSKKLDIEMMMKRKMNRLKKEYQVFMHKVHVLCWLGHGNYVSGVLNDQEIMSASLSLIPSKDCYPGVQVDIKYIEQITTWYKNKVTLKQDKNENKFKPKAPPLKHILLEQIRKKVFTTKRYIIFAFISMLRSLGLQCRVMFNFVTLPIKPPITELHSLSTKPKEEIKSTKNSEDNKLNITTSKKKAVLKNLKIPQLDGNYDIIHSDSDTENIMQIDGNDDVLTTRTRRARNNSAKTNIHKHENTDKELDKGDVSPPKRPRRGAQHSVPNCSEPDLFNKNKDANIALGKTIRTRSKIKLQSQNTSPRKSLSLNRQAIKDESSDVNMIKSQNKSHQEARHPQTKRKKNQTSAKLPQPQITITNEKEVSSKYFENQEETKTSVVVVKKRSRTSEPKPSIDASDKQSKQRTRSAQGTTTNRSKYFQNNDDIQMKPSKSSAKKVKVKSDSDDSQRVSHKDLGKKKVIQKGDVTNDLVHIIKERVKEAKTEARKGIVKGKVKKESDEDSDYLPIESPKHRNSGSDDDFKQKKITPKSKVSSVKKRIDRRVISTDDEAPSHKINVWCEIFVEELEEWIAVDVLKGKVHCAKEIYSQATHPVAYVVGWDNNNHLKDLTRKYVPQWNTVTRKQRVDAPWWIKALKPWLGPKTPRDREEDERLDRMQLDAPLPTSIGEYKNHPLYALQRHLLKFEAIYPADAAVLGFVRKEPVFARECVHTCRSRDTWLKEAKVVRLGEQPYKIVKARPKWDKLSNKLITDKPLEVFGPWQVQDYEPPVAENGIVPRNAYGNVELFKECMLPKGTVHIKLPSLNRVAKKLNIDCAPAMTGFDFNGGWSHPVFDGFVVCQEFGEIITEAWLKDQEEQERREVEKLETRVYGNWRKLIKGLLIKERLKAKYGFEEAGTSQDTKKSKGPRLVIKKK